jgi:aldehyde dehydrogenase (NAD+)
MQLDPHTDLASISGTVKTLRNTFNSRVTRPLAWRRQQLRNMINMLENNEAELLEALKVDLGKPMAEAFITDLAFVTGEIKLMLKNLNKWNSVEKVPTPLVAMPAKSVLIPEPLGLSLIHI